MVTTKEEKFVKEWVQKLDLRENLLNAAVRMGVPFKHPDTGKWHDTSGLGFDSHEALVKYGDAFVFPNRPFKLR